MTSGALWIPLLWIMIIGSRPISLWFGGEIQMETQDDYLEGSPLDRNVFLILIITGLMVLFRRRVDWSKLFASNRWFFAFLLYCGISVMWSYYPFVSFKRWTKELGNVIMILIILTEKDNVQAFKAVFSRYTYFAIPLSVLFIKYIPAMGRYYNRWTWEPGYSGISTNKNELGCVLFVCGLWLVWDLVEMRKSSSGQIDKLDLCARILLLLMVFWLISIANSSTALVCFIIGTCILLFMQRPSVRRHIKYLGTYSLSLGFLLLILYTVPGVLEALVGLVGRDMTFTGRTDLWTDLLTEPINPLIGTGYESFWLGPGAQRMWEKYYFHPVQAHNGYLQTYLNDGLVGVGLLIAMIVSAGTKLKKDLLAGSSFGILRFSFLVLVLFCNWTEAMFSGISLVWIIMLIAALNYPTLPRSCMETAK